MKTELGALTLAVPLALIALTGCGMTAGGSTGIPSAGISTSRDASDAMEEVPSGIRELIGVKGKASDSRPGVTAELPKHGWKSS
ncbi:hypothetical protein ABZS63_26010, partial [Streptomyces sp. NPDC005568]